MSEVIGRWILAVQDEIPAKTRNSDDWRTLLASAAGTGRTRESARTAVVKGWLHDKVLPHGQRIADACGCGPKWHTMRARRRSVANGTRRAATTGNTGNDGARNRRATSPCAWKSSIHGATPAYAASAARGVAGMHKAYAGNDPQARERARENAWQIFEPCETLKRLIKVGSGEDRHQRRQGDAQQRV